MLLTGPCFRFLLRAAVWSVLLVVASTGVAAAAPIVAATNTIIADFVRRVGGDDVETRCIVPAGLDLHGFEPKPADVAALATARLVVANGAGIEPWMDKLVESSGYSGPIIAASAGCPLVPAPGSLSLDPETSDKEAGAHASLPDPHAWQDVLNAIRYVENIRAALSRAFPASAPAFRERARRYTDELEELDVWIRQRFAPIPPAARRIVTTHAALAYFGRAYGLTIVSLHGIDSRQMPDSRQMARLVDALRTKKIRAIFPEALTNAAMLQQLARDTGAELGPALHTDALGAPGTVAETYIGMMRQNADAIARTLSRK